MFYYNISLRGSSHIKNGKPNQDYSKVYSNKKYIISAVADGVGSAKYSEIGSKTAVETVLDFCVNEMNKFQTSNDEDIINVIRDSYLKAQENIEKIAEDSNNEISDYDTTLSVVIYDGKKVFYGHSGDGGIILLTQDGEYLKLTNPQKGDDGVCVIPLRFGIEKWEFGIFNSKNVSAVSLATDGIYDNFYPYLLKDEKVEIYVPLIRYFMDNNILNINKKNLHVIENERIKFLESPSCEGIVDDKTLIVLINEKLNPEIKEEEYYKEPDWNELKEKWNKKAYPHLYNKNS